MGREVRRVLPWELIWSLSLFYHTESYKMLLNTCFLCVYFTGVLYKRKSCAIISYCSVLRVFEEYISMNHSITLILNNKK